MKRADRRLAMADRALAALPGWWQQIETTRDNAYSPEEN